MTDTATPPAGGSALRKKVLGVPVLYLAGGFAVILVAIAWKTKSAAPAASADSGSATSDPASDTILSEETTPPVPVGTVTAPPSTVPDTANASIDTNDEWLSRGVATLIKMGYGPGDAQLALSLYLDGAELSYEQGKMRDSAIRELGLPPYPVNIGGTRPDVGRTQGPLPRTHIVKNTAESTAAKLASLYYNRNDAFSIRAITGANGGRASFNVGDSVVIPLLPTPTNVVAHAKPAVPAKPAARPSAAPAHAATAKRYYTVKHGDTLSGIAYRYYHNAAKYPVIQKANGIRDANKITVGQRLLIP